MKVPKELIAEAERRGLIAGPAKAKAERKPPPLFDSEAGATGPADPVRYLNELPADAVVVRATHEGEPIVKERPRFNRLTARVYTPGSTKEHQRALADVACLAAGPFAADEEWAYGIRAVFRVQTHHRKDVDNMMKTLLDAMNKLVFKDDSQVKEIMAWSVVDAECPRTEFAVYRLYKIDRELGYCAMCHTPFRRYKSWKSRLYCSRACYAMKERKKEPVRCAGCGEAVLRTPDEMAKSKGGEFFCSGACIMKRKRRKIACGQCGAEISRPQSLTKPGQAAFYCDKKCYDASRVGRKSDKTPEELSERSRKAWVTRRAKSAD